MITIQKHSAARLIFTNTNGLLLMAFVLVFFSHTHAQRPRPDRPPAKTYYDLIDSLMQASPEAQIAHLHNFLKAHPHEERAYLKLLERYQLQQKAAEAQTFFLKLAREPQHHRNSLWMLARLAARDPSRHDREATLKNFVLALSDTQALPSTALLYDYVEFFYENSEPLANSNWRYNQTLRPDQQTLGAVFYHYLNGDHEQVFAAVRKISPQARRELLLLYVLSDFSLRDENAAMAPRWAQADSLCQLGLSLARQNDEREFQTRFWARLGDLAFHNNEFEQARAYYDSAYALAKRLDDVYGLQKALGGFGKVDYMNNAHAEATARYREALTKAERIGAYRDASLWHSNSCQPLYEIGKFAEALEACAKGKHYAELARDHEGILRIQLKLARLYHELVQHEIAKKICSDAIDLALRRNYIKQYQRAEALLADILFEEKRFAEVRELCNRYIAYLEKTGNLFERHSYVAKIADTYRAEKQYDQALALYERAGREARAHGSEFYAAWYTLEIAEIAALQGKLQQALQSLEMIQPIFQEYDESEGLIRLNLNVGRLQQKSGALERALKAYQNAATIIDSTRQKIKGDPLRTGYFRNHTQAYQGLAECFFQRYQTHGERAALDSIWQHVQMTKGRSFLDLVEKADAPRDKTDNTYTQAYQQARADLQKLQQRLRQVPDEYEELHSRLETARYSVAVQRLHLSEDAGGSLQRAIPNISLQETTRLLREMNASLLLYHVSEEAAFVFAITGDKCVALPLHTTRAQLMAAIDSLMSPFHRLNGGAVLQLPYRAELAHRLYRILLEPVENALPLLERLVIVPDLILTHLPFEMLLLHPPSQNVYTPVDSPAYAADFLLHRYAMVYSPTVQGLRENLQSRSSATGVFVLANPFIKSATIQPVRATKKSRQFEPLPFTDLEAERIGKIYGRTQKRTRAQATEAAFFNTAPSQRIVHLATHAFVDTTFEDFSGLLLALDKTDENDGLLMGYEIADLKLRADLVTLSACETGLGELAEGEGVLGLPRLFLRAGAKSVLMTLWQVHDEFAAELMPKFYDYFLNGKRSKVEALAQAKRALLQETGNARGEHFQHPFYWAAFTLYGDPGRSETGFMTTNKIMIVLAVLMLSALLFYLRVRVRKASGTFATRKNAL